MATNLKYRHQPNPIETSVSPMVGQIMDFFTMVCNFHDLPMCG